MEEQGFKDKEFPSYIKERTKNLNFDTMKDYQFVKLFLSFGTKSHWFPYDSMMHDVLFPNITKCCGEHILLGNMMEISDRIFNHNLYNKIQLDYLYERYMDYLNTEHQKITPDALGYILLAFAHVGYHDFGDWHKVFSPKGDFLIHWLSYALV